MGRRPHARDSGKPPGRGDVVALLATEEERDELLTWSREVKRSSKLWLSLLRSDEQSFLHQDPVVLSYLTRLENAATLLIDNLTQEVEA